MKTTSLLGLLTLVSATAPAFAAPTYSLLPKSTASCRTIDSKTGQATKVAAYSATGTRAWKIFGMVELDQAPTANGECTLTESSLCLELVGPEVAVNATTYQQKAVIHYYWVVSDIPAYPFVPDASETTLECVRQ